MSVYLNTGCHAVLALLSEGYPPLEGRSPTRYSPVCHSTRPLRDFRVRLACIRHAASVDSEPGSNSQVKFADPSTAPYGTGSGHNCLTQAPVELALGFIPARAPCGVAAGPFKYAEFVSQTLQSRSRSALILDGLCLHVLSSFQRTGTPSRASPPARKSSGGEPSKLTTGNPSLST